MRLATTLLLVSWALSYAVPCRAQTKIYLGEYQLNNPRLYRMEPTGAALEELFIIPAADWLVVGVQVDESNGKIYWAHGGFNEGRIRRANLDGSGMQTIQSGLTSPRGLALDAAGGKVYWSDPQDNAMYRCNVTGTGLEPIVSAGDQLGNPTLDLAGGKIYFGNYTQGEIGRANLDGSGQEPLFGGVFTPIAIALDLANGKIYWADSNTTFVSNHIARANLNGSAQEVLFTGCCVMGSVSSGFSGIGLDLPAGKLYWCDEIYADEKGAWEANLDGSGATRIFASPAGWNAAALTVLPAPSAGPTLVRGNCNADSAFNIGDPITLLAVLFSGGAAPACDDACDANDDGAMNIGDAVSMLSSLFTAGTPSPPAPFPGCGVDPTADMLGCAAFAPCP